MTTRTLLLLPAAALLLAACGPRIEPVMRPGEVIQPESPAVIERARAEGEAERAYLGEMADHAYADALARCAPAICDAIGRGELMLGMSRTEVLAATRSSAGAWETRGSAGTEIMTGGRGATGPSDVRGEVAFVTMQDGRLRSVTYRHPEGYRTVATPADATDEGRRAARADALLREGEDFAARGDLAGALDRFDRADILRPGHPETTLQIATTLDKQLRPLEALMRYQLFLHQMELDRIEARGEAAARMAEAIALARERIIVLERR
jgi:hypothetical protein